MKANYTVAVCDILGFGSYVKRSSLDCIINDSLSWFSKAMYQLLNKSEFPEHQVTLKELQSNPQLGMAWFSDTILVYTRHDDDKCLCSLLQFLSFLLFETMYVSEVRIRCGVSYGEAFIDPENSLFVGLPIVNAYQLERKQQWSGGALTNEAVQRIPEFARNGKFTDWPVIPYHVPVKEGQMLNTLAIDWTIGIHEQDDFLFPYSRGTPEPSPDDWRTRKSICEKWSNTRAFHQHVCHYCRPP